MKAQEGKTERTRSALAAIACALALVIAGCGDDGDDRSVSIPSTPLPPAETLVPDHGGDGSGSSGGGEKSIEQFGSEAEGSEHDAIVGSFKGYLEAIAGQDFTAACSYLASNVQRSLSQLPVKGLKSKGCPAILPKLLAPTAKAVARQQAEGRITKVRVERGRAFVVFHAPGAKLFQMTMVRENGNWKAATVAASTLVPDL